MLAASLQFKERRRLDISTDVKPFGPEWGYFDQNEAISARSPI
jgi:hypothetical protein